jgi:hypothetical protein
MLIGVTPALVFTADVSNAVVSILVVMFNAVSRFGFSDWLEIKDLELDDFSSTSAMMPISSTDEF